MRLPSSIDEGSSCLTSCDVDGRLIVIVGNAGGTRINGSGIPGLSDVAATPTNIELEAEEDLEDIVRVGSRDA